MISVAFSGTLTETSPGVRVKGDPCWASLVAVAIALLTLFPPSSAKAEFGFLAAWGSGETTYGGFYAPYAVAVDRDGNVYVADTHNRRIVKFDSSGDFLAKWGKYGTGDGRFSALTGIAVDPSGDVYVADSSNHRIQKFDASGAFQRMWGWGVRDGADEFQICTGSCRAGKDGDGDGQLHDPYGVAADSQGDVYVADSYNNRIQKFDASGNFLAKWGEGGAGDGELSEPRGVAVDFSGHVYVADSSNDRIQKFDASGAFQRMWGWGVRDGADEFQICTGSCRAGIEGDGDGQLHYPFGVAADSQGDVYVADSYNNRIHKFDASGAFQRMWGWGVTDGQDEFQICTGSCRAGKDGNGDGQLHDPSGVAADSQGNVYVSDTSNNRIQKFDASGNFLAKWGSERTADGWLDKPVGVAVDSSGNVYVADSYNNRIQKFDSSGSFLAKWGHAGTGDGQFSNPVGIAVDSSGDVYVSDSSVFGSSNHRIQKFDASGAFQRMWGWGVRDGANEFQICTSSCRAGIQGPGDGQLNDPYGIAADSSGGVYVADTENNRIQKFDARGNFLSKWGEHGSGDGELSEPRGVAVDSRGDVYVADSYNNRIQKFDSSGGFLAKWGRAGMGDGRFNYPFGVSVDSSGGVYVADAFNNRIQKFDSSSGNFLAKWGKYGVGAGQFDSPYGVAAGSQGDVYVADMGNNRIQKFGELPEATPIPGLPQPLPPALLAVAGPEHSTAYNQACNLRLTSPRVKEVGSPTVEISAKRKGRSPRNARQIFTKGLKGHVDWGKVGARKVVCKKIRMAILERRDGKYYVPGTRTRVSEKRLTARSFAKRTVRFLAGKKVGVLKRKPLEDKRITRISFKEFRGSNGSTLGKTASKSLRKRRYRGSFVLIYTAEIEGTTVKKTFALP